MSQAMSNVLRAWMQSCQRWIKSGLRADLVELAAQPASEAQILAVHERRLLEFVRAAASRGPQWLGADTYIMPGSWDAARMAAGAAATAVEAVLTGQVSNAFALIRPPGHHATPSQPMGFCLLNNIAIAARHALDALGDRAGGDCGFRCASRQWHAGLLLR